MIPEEVWRIYNGEVKKYILSKVSDGFEAEDLFQEVGCRVIQSQGKLMDVENTRSWLYRVATNAIYDHYRRKDKVLYREDMENVLGHGNPTSEEDNYNSEAAACLLKMAELLPQTDKEAVLQSDFKGIPQNRLGEKWGISHSGAKNRVQRARRKLRQKIEACCEVRSDHQGNIIELVHRENAQENLFCTKC